MKCYDRAKAPRTSGDEREYVLRLGQGSWLAKASGSLTRSSTNYREERLSVRNGSGLWF